MLQISNINKVNQPYLTKFEFKKVFNFIEYKSKIKEKYKSTFHRIS